MRRQMGGITAYGVLLSACLLAALTRAEVFVTVEHFNGAAWINYACTSGEVVRAFPLDVTVDQGEIIGITRFFVGESTADAQGYGIFPASFRDHINVNPATGEVLNWDVSDYTPVADVADAPGDTLPGLNSSGVTLEFGGLWEPGIPEAIPGSTGLLCALQVSTSANVSVAVNLGRGGVVSTNPAAVFDPVLTGAFVDPSTRVGLIMGATIQGGSVFIQFDGGELEATTNFWVDWTGTGNTSGMHADPLTGLKEKQYRARP